jgi:hypothetical protein
MVGEGVAMTIGVEKNRKDKDFGKIKLLRRR